MKNIMKYRIIGDHTAHDRMPRPVQHPTPRGSTNVRGYARRLDVAREMAGKTGRVECNVHGNLWVQL